MFLVLVHASQANQLIRQIDNDQVRPEIFPIDPKQNFSDAAN